MRLAIFATPAQLPGEKPPPGAIDSDLLRGRLPQADAGYLVESLDPTRDLAEQIDALFDRPEAASAEGALFYASASVVVSMDGELFLCLDPANPAVGDALSDLATVFAERCSGPLLFVIECRHAPEADDPFHSANVVAAARRAIGSNASGIEALVAARPFGDLDGAASPFTRALVASLDASGSSQTRTARELFDVLRVSDGVIGAVPAFSHLAGRTAFAIARPRPAVDSTPRIEPADTDRDPIPSHPVEEPKAPAAVVAPPVVAAPPPPVETSRSPSLPSSDAAPASRGQKGDRAEPVTTVEVRKSVPPPPMDERRVIVADVPRAAAPKLAEPQPSVIIAEPVASTRSPEPPPTSPSPSPPAPAAATPKPPRSGGLKILSASEHIAEGNALARAGDDAGALNEFKKALGLLGKLAVEERAEVYVRIGSIKRRQNKVREAISNFEKALGVDPKNTVALEALLDLNASLGEWRAVHSAEDRVIAALRDPSEIHARLVEFGVRWMDQAKDALRARTSFQRALEIKPDDRATLVRLRAIFEAEGEVEKANALRRKIIELTPEPHEKALALFELAKECVSDPAREDEALELLDQALEADPTELQPLEVIAKLLAERQEWSELELAYRRMLTRAPRIPAADVRSEVTWELCRSLGLLFRDHLVDPVLALEAFEEALKEKPADVAGHLTAASLAREVSALDRAVTHLRIAAVLDPARVSTFHDLFDASMSRGEVDAAFLAAAVTTYRGASTSREAAAFEAGKPGGLPQPKSTLGAESWDLLRLSRRTRHVDAILEAVAQVAIAARFAELSAAGRLPTLDPATRQDPEKSTVSITRSFNWASHFLGVKVPAVYISDDASLGLAAVPAPEPTVLAGGSVLRGRSLPDLAFLVGRQLAYYVGAHRLLLYYPSLDDLSACFLAAVKIVMPDLPVPAKFVEASAQLQWAIQPKLSAADVDRLTRAVRAFDAAGTRADLGEWVALVEKTATRAGYLLAGDLAVVGAILSAEPLRVVSPEEKMADLMGFSVSPAYHTLREQLGIAVKPT